MVSSASTLFIMPKYFKWKDPGLSFTLSGDEITVHANAFAKSVEISNGEDNLILSDNFFDMNGGSRTVKILSGKPEGIQVKSVYDIGRS